MVVPIDEKIVGRTLEDRLAHKFDDLQMAREDRQAELFDEIARSIEVLMKAVPDAYEQLMAERRELDADLAEETTDIERDASYAKDEIHRQAIYQSRGFKAMWEYREVYEEIIIEVMQKHQLIPIRKPQKSMLRAPDESLYLSPEEMQQRVAQLQQAQQPPQSQNPPQQSVPVPPPITGDNPANDKPRKKPKLSFKRGENQPRNFNI